jgi:hypothetical protein
MTSNAASHGTSSIATQLRGCDCDGCNAPGADDCEHLFEVLHVLCIGEVLRCELCGHEQEYEVDP